MDPVFTVFAALCTLMGVGIFSLLIPKAIDHFKDHNVRTLKELEEVRKGEGVSKEDKTRLDKMINLRREAYLDKQEQLMPEFENTYRINYLKNVEKNPESLSELHFRNLMAKKYDREFNKKALFLFGGIVIGGTIVVSFSWIGANLIIQWFH